MVKVSKKIFLVVFAMLIAHNNPVGAFGGGGGHSRVHEWYKHGVDSIGVHIGGNRIKINMNLLMKVKSGWPS